MTKRYCIAIRASFENVKNVAQLSATRIQGKCVSVVIKKKVFFRKPFKFRIFYLYNRRGKRGNILRTQNPRSGACPRNGSPPSGTSSRFLVFRGGCTCQAPATSHKSSSNRIARQSTLPLPFLFGLSNPPSVQWRSAVSKSAKPLPAKTTSRPR